MAALSTLMRDIASAIRKKKGTTKFINPQDFAMEIASIEGGGTPPPDMPVIGDGKTYLYIKIAAEGRMTVPLYFSQTVSNGVTIDWGDGSATQTLSGTGKVNTSHKYAEVGEYTISLNPTSGCTLGLGQNTTSVCIIGSTNAQDRVYCNMLRSVEIGKNTIITNYAFANCYSLTCVHLPDGVTSIGNQSFYYCLSLREINIPDGVTSIGNYAFSTCYSLQKVTLPDSVTSIGDRAFFTCRSLGEFIFPPNVTTLKSYMFDGCYSLARVVLPKEVTQITANIFSSCQSLASIKLPQSVTSIAAYAFNVCACMAFYDFSECTSVPTLANINAFNSIPSDCKIVVPDSLYDAWVVATNWSTYANNIIKASEFNS